MLCKKLQSSYGYANKGIPGMKNMNTRFALLSNNTLNCSTNSILFSSQAFTFNQNLPSKQCKGNCEIIFAFERKFKLFRTNACPKDSKLQLLFAIGSRMVNVLPLPISEATFISPL